MRTHVARIVREIRVGRFKLTPDCIAKTQSGYYINGQHRLRAIIDAGVGAWMIVSEGWPDETFDVLDAGVRRSLRARAEKAWLNGSSIGVAVVRATIEVSIGRSKATEGDVIAVADAGEQWFTAVLNCFSDKRKIHSTVWAACVRAHMNGVDTQTIARFLTVYVRPELSEGIHESASVMLHRRFTEMRGNGGGYTMRSMMYKIAASALDHFMKGRQVTKLYARNEDLFPLPQIIIAEMEADELEVGEAES